MDLSVSTIIPGIIFGIIGMWMIKQSKSRGNFTLAMIGLVTVAYTYFISNAWLDWGIGIGLCYWASKVW